MVVGAMYARKYLQQDSKAVALEMVNGMRKEFEVLLKEAKWMDDKTRQLALNKLAAMSIRIGYPEPDEILNDAKFKKWFENIHVNERSVVSTMLNVSSKIRDSAFNELREPVNKSDWTTYYPYPTFVNAYYEFYENRIRKNSIF